jgi:hypothetical protein
MSPIRVKTALTMAVMAIGTTIASASASAATVSLSSACYVTPTIGLGATIQVSGSGYTPGEAVFAQIPAPGGLLSFVEATVASDGTFTATLTDVIPPSIKPAPEKETMQIKGVLSGVILAQAPFELTNLAVETKPSFARPRKKVSFSFAGFAAGKPIYGHFLHKGRVVLTHDFGVAAGACGVLESKSRIFPGHARYSSYVVQFDDSRAYSKSTTQKVETNLSIERF